MLELIIPPFEYYREDIEEIVSINKPTVLRLEHSLISISLWEAKWHKAFLITNERIQQRHTEEEMVDYILKMSIDPVDPNVIYGLNGEHLRRLQEYLNDPATATTIYKHNDPQRNKSPKPSTKLITSELIYSWMVALQIPFEPCERWNINRLLMLIEVCNAEQNSDKKMNKNDILKSNRALNAARCAKLNTKG